MSDLIDRQAAIDMFNRLADDQWNANANTTWSKAYGYAAEMIEELPSAQPEPRWTPVTERLPKLGEKVLVSTKNTVFVQVFKCIYGTPDNWGWEHHTNKKVTAWMPLPEPYRKETEDE